MKKQKFITILLSLCVVSILLVYIFNSYPKPSKNKRSNEIKNAKNIFKEGEKQEPTKHNVSKQKTLSELEVKEPAIKNKITAINSKRADEELEEQFSNLLEDKEALFGAANLGFEAHRLLQNKSRFFDRATQEQRNKDKEVLNKLRSAMNIPTNLQFQGTFDKKTMKILAIHVTAFSSHQVITEKTEPANLHTNT